MSRLAEITIIRHEPGNFHLGIWFNRHAASLRLGWWAMIWKRL